MKFGVLIGLILLGLGVGLFFILQPVPIEINSSSCEQKPIQGEKEKIVLTLFPYDSPVELLRQFAPLLKHLSESTGHPFGFSVSHTYDSHINRIGNDEVAFAIMGSVPYVVMTEKFGQKKMLCTFSSEGGAVFTGYVVVRDDNPSTSLKDLQNQSFAISSMESTMSYILPRYLFIQAGVPFPEEHLKFVRSHNNVCLNVLSGDAYAGGIKERSFLKYKDHGLKIIAITPPVIDHLFVATDKLDADLADQIQEVLLAIRDPADVKRLLAPIKSLMVGLSIVEDADYDALRAIIQTVRADEEQFAEKNGEKR